MGGKKWKHLRSLFGQKDWLESMAEKWLAGSKHSQRLRKKKTDRPTNQPSAKLCPLFGNRQTDIVPSATTFGERRLFWASQPLSSSPYILKVHWDMFFVLCGCVVAVLKCCIFWPSSLTCFICARRSSRSQSVFIARLFFLLFAKLLCYILTISQNIFIIQAFFHTFIQSEQSTRGTMGDICRKNYINIMFKSLK